MRKFALFLIAFISIIQLQAQNGVAISTSSSATPDASAILDVQSTSHGMLIPRMTQAQRDAISSPTTSLMIYQTDNTFGFYYYNGTSWTTLSGAKSINDLTDAKAYTTSVFIGQYSGHSATGTKNTGVGFSSLYALTTGQENVAIGYYAGKSITKGNLNIMIGGDINGTEPSSATANRELNIGNTIYATDIYHTTAKVGIGNGNNAPAATLDVNGDVKVGTSISIGTAIHLTPGSAPTSPTEGDMYMDSSTHKLMVYDGTNWQACW